MTRRRSPSGFGIAREELPAQLTLLLVYEDAPTGLRGKWAVEHVLRRPGVNARYSLHAWRQDMLRDESCRAVACEQASNADILMVSAHGDGSLAPETEASLKQWVGLVRGKPRALVISLDSKLGASGSASEAVARLREVASRNGWTVLMQYGDVPHERDAGLHTVFPRELSPAQLAEESEQAAAHFRWRPSH